MKVFHLCHWMLVEEMTGHIASCAKWFHIGGKFERVKC